MEGWAPILEWGLQHWGLQWREWGAERSPAPRWKPGPAGASFQVQSGLAKARAPASATLIPCPQALGLALPPSLLEADLGRVLYINFTAFFPNIFVSNGFISILGPISMNLWR